LKNKLDYKKRINKSRTSILIEEKAKRITQKYKNTITKRLYDKYKCTECGIETFIRRDVSKGKRYCECQNTFIGNERIYWSWRSMIERCDNKNNPAYKDYGARGIKIADIDWYDFKKFKKWAEASGYTDELTIDRIDVNGNYEPSNCRWITKYQQTLNKRNNRLMITDVIKIRQMKKDGFKNKDIYKKFKDKVNHKTYIDSILRNDRWDESKW